VQVPELNVQNGVLKSLSFLFEYIGEMGKDYIYAVTPLLEDALMDRDLVHRQTAASVIQHMALGVAGVWAQVLGFRGVTWAAVEWRAPQVLHICW
jgi:splicing factor 3B subunit 1